MADPASVAGTAVGVISLGIQICQGLVSYYEQWKSFDDDIAHLHAKIDGLRITLENLERTLRKFKNSNANIVKDVEEKIASSMQGIRKLEAVLTKCHSFPSANSVQQNGYRLIQKTFYPFKKATIQELKVSVTDLENNLKTSIHSLTLDVLGDQRQLVISTSQLAREEMKQVKYEIRSINANMEVFHEGMPQILQQTDAIQNATFNLSSTLKAGLENLQTCQENVLPEFKNCMEALPGMIENSFRLRLDDHIQQLVEIFQTPQLTNYQRTAEIPKRVQPIRAVQARLLEKPSLLRDVCDEMIGKHGSIQLSSMKKSQPFVNSSSCQFLKRPTCTCRPATYSVEFHGYDRQRSRGRRWSAMLNRSATTHRKDCAFFNYSNRDISLDLRLAYCGRVIAQAVITSIQIRRGAGGFSISPSLSCIRVVSSDSPVFRLLQNFCGTFSLLNFISPVDFDDPVRELVKLFQDGQASPCDVNLSGQSLLHIVSPYATTLLSRGREDESSRFLENICRLGVPMNEVDEYGATFLDRIEHEVCSGSEGRGSYSIRRMLDLGAEYVRPGPGDLNEKSIVCFAARTASIEELAEATNFNEICKAVLSRSESQLKAAIESYSHQIDEPSFLQLRPLHLSVEWPCGIETLLKNKANVNVTDENGLHPIDHAVYRACTKSIDLFDKADCALYALTQSQRQLQTLDIATTLERCAATDERRTIRANIVDLIIEIQAQRRRKLRSLLTRSLPERVILSLSLHEDRLLDEQAPAATAALERHNISIPISLKINHDYETVYHYLWLNVRILNSLWEAGFRDVNGLNSFGQNPLMAKYLHESGSGSSLKVIAWFVMKDIDIYQKVYHLHQTQRKEVDASLRCSYLISGHTVLHYVCYNLPISLLFYHFDQKMLSPGSQAYLKVLTSSQIQDMCKCACSSAGCQAIHMLFKGLLDGHRWGDKGVLWRDLCVTNYKDLYLYVWEDAMTSNQLLSELVRFSTFELLGLTHTCCRTRSYLDQNDSILMPLAQDEEIQEIHKEEWEDLQLLEDLMIEFDQKRRELGCSITEFIEGYWWNRMNEILSEQKPMSYDKIREIGVVIHDFDSKTEDREPRHTYFADERGLKWGRTL